MLVDDTILEYAYVLLVVFCWSQKSVSNAFPYSTDNSNFKPSCQIDRGQIKVPQIS